MTDLQVAFIIPHKGREDMLRDTVNSIINLALPTDRQVSIDIVVITQNEKLRADFAPLLDSVSLKVIHESPALTISALRNRGVMESDANMLAFIDADIRLSSNWLTDLEPMLHQDDGVVLVSAAQQCATDAPPLEQLRTALSNASVDAPAKFLPGRNLLLSRSTFDTVGGFPEHLVTCEDYYFTDKVGELGRLWYSSKASYVHLGEDRIYSEMFRKEIWRGQSNLQSIAGRRISLSEWPSFVVPLWITAGLAFAALLVIAQLWLPATILGLLALIPFAAYSVRLFSLAPNGVGIRHVLLFYAYYFPARAWGTLVGLVKPLGTTVHES